jgi:chromosome segregation ATPase
MATSPESIEEILGELKSLNASLSTDNNQHYTDFTQFKMEYFERNEDMRESLRDIKGDVRSQSQDIDGLQTDIGELKEEFKRMKFDLAPIIELKQYIQGQVIRYSSVGFLFVLGATLGLSNFGP